MLVEFAAEALLHGTHVSTEFPQEAEHNCMHTASIGAEILHGESRIGGAGPVLSVVTT